MRVGTHQRIGIGRPASVHLRAEDHGREVLQVDLVHDACVRRHHAEVAEGGLSPAQQDIALAIALEFQQCVDAEGILAAELIHLHGMIDDEVGRKQRIGEPGVGAHFGERVAHGGEIDDTGHAGEVLQQDARRHEADLLGVGSADTARHIIDIGSGDLTAVLIAEQVLE